MGKIETALAKAQPCILSLLRFVVGLVFLQHGTQKVLGFPAPMAPAGGMAMAGPHAPPPGWHLDLSSVIGWSGGLEFFGGILLVFGLFTRPVAFLLSGEMAVAYFMVHAPRGFFPIANGGDGAILFCFVFFYLVFAGGGRWSADALIARRNTPA